MSFDSAGSGADSAQQSKRSLADSHASKSCSSSNSKRSKTSSKQKTLGTAWGANSVSSSRSSFRTSPFSDFGSYMSEKTRKLRQQFDAEASHSSGSSSKEPIFQGVSIFIDGFTIPSNQKAYGNLVSIGSDNSHLQELRSYMLMRGGRFENYFSRSRVTHIICSNLPDSKRKNLRSFSAGLPVVKPAWILDSVFANRLLDWVPYQLDQLGDNQPRLSAFFSSKSSSVVEDTLEVAGCQLNVDQSCRGGTSNDVDLPEVRASMNDAAQGVLTVGYRQVNPESSRQAGTGMNDEFSDMHDCISIASDRNPQPDIEEPISNKFSDVRMEVPGNSDTECETNRGSRFKRTPDNKNTTASSSGGIGLFSRCHSTLGDPNFVENYFKSSRLHFIGTWRNRYRKRYGSRCNDFKNQNANCGASDASYRTSVIHIDMDCFFVSVVIRNRAELQDKPVAICHSDNPKGTAEISSANYPARNFGVKAGMFVREAKARCPHLIIFPYNFQAYEEVADKFYDILHKHCSKVQAVSCDEAFLEVTISAGLDPEFTASRIRKEIFETTGCTASAGIAGNMLMARLATRAAKPNGQCYIPQERVEEHLQLLPIKALPGIGHVLAEKLKNHNIQTCGQLRLISKESLQRDFGAKTGEMLWNYSRGLDNRLVGVIQESKSIGAEVNWGVRFKALEDSYHFLAELCKEVSLRLLGCGARGRTFTLKIKRRRKDAGEPVKYMGCGDCENLSHSMTIPIATDDIGVLQRITKQLFVGFQLGGPLRKCVIVFRGLRKNCLRNYLRSLPLVTGISTVTCLPTDELSLNLWYQFYTDVRDIRGVGLQVSKLENADASNQGLERSSLRSWLISASATKAAQRDTTDLIQQSARDLDSDINSTGGTSRQLFPGEMGSSTQMDGNLDQPCVSEDVSAPPPLCDLDVGVVENLPPEIFSELNDIYGGKLIALINTSKDNTETFSNTSCIPNRGYAEGEPYYVVGADISNVVSPSNSLVEAEVKQLPDPEARYLVPGAGSDGEAAYKGCPENTDLMQSSSNQFDTSVLPEELRVDLVGLLPIHSSNQELPSDGVLDVHADNADEFTVATADDQSTTPPNDLSSDLLIGNPPKWVDKFRISNCLILNSLAEMYYKWGPTRNLSPLLQHLVSEIVYPLNEGVDVWDDEASRDFCTLLMQYIKVNLESDIEEIHFCFQLLRRFGEKSKLVSQVYDIVLPYLQECFRKVYGGRLNI